MFARRFSHMLDRALTNKSKAIAISQGVNLST